MMNPIKAVLFDFDGTLTEPGGIDYAAIRQRIDCPPHRHILEYIESLPSGEKLEALEILDQYEFEAALRSRPNSGAEELLQFLVSRNVRIGITSRNSLRSIDRAFQNFERFRPSDFEIVITREDPLTPKPSPESILAAARKFQIPAEQILVVGDFIFDVVAGRKAGARTAFLTNRVTAPVAEPAPDFTIDELSELREIVDLHAPLPAGKLPNRFLARFLREMSSGFSSLLVAPGVGEDIAAVAYEGEGILVLKSDPITFATDAISTYAVVVNLNDIATAGASPRWLLTTLLFPPGTSAAQIRESLSELQAVALQNQLVLCGGHTEITDAVNRPVIVGQVVGTVSRDRLVVKSGMRKGDRILLTKGVAVEGTSILAREFPDLLLSRGVATEEIERCRQLLFDPGISILKEAAIAVRAGGVSAMHDVTEGGVATALEEFAAAGNRRLRVYLDQIPLLPETTNLCRALGLNPLGLIGSGSLLIACDPDSASRILESIREAGIQATLIGEVLGRGRGVEAAAHPGGDPVAWPRFEVDEIARVFQIFGSKKSS